MFGSLDGRDVIGREEGILRVPIRQGSGLGGPARGTAGPGLEGSCGGAGNAVLEELLIFAPPVLPEQRFTRTLPRATARHDPVLPWAACAVSARSWPPSAVTRFPFLFKSDY